MLIGNIAFLFSGIYANTSSSRGEEVYYIQIRHWDKQKNWQQHVEPELRLEDRFAKSYLKPGDLLIVTKGTDFFAVLYDGRYAPAIASSVFTVLRIKDTNNILPAYLQWFLNHPNTSKTFVGASKGTSTPLITKDVIENLEMPVPSLERQKNILRLEQLHRSAASIRSRINQLNETVFYSHLLQKANGE
jgi:restriction endonuclease S subunit